MRTRRPPRLGGEIGPYFSWKEEISAYVQSRILIVDDDELILALLGFPLTCCCPAARSARPAIGAAALDELRRQPFDLILTDYYMPKTERRGISLGRPPDFSRCPNCLMSAG